MRYVVMPYVFNILESITAVSELMLDPSLCVKCYRMATNIVSHGHTGAKRWRYGGELTQLNRDLAKCTHITCPS